MKAELEEIVEKHLEGNYLMGAMSKKLMVDELYEFINQDKVREAAEKVVAVYEWDDWNDDIIVLISPIVELTKVLQKY